MLHILMINTYGWSVGHLPCSILFSTSPAFIKIEKLMNNEKDKNKDPPYTVKGYRN